MNYFKKIFFGFLLILILSGCQTIRHNHYDYFVASSINTQTIKEFESIALNWITTNISPTKTKLSLLNITSKGNPNKEIFHNNLIEGLQQNGYAILLLDNINDLGSDSSLIYYQITSFEDNYVLQLTIGKKQFTQLFLVTEEGLKPASSLTIREG